MKTAAVIISGCGYLDGAEIRESVLTLLELENAGIIYQIFAPDTQQHHVINHMTSEEQSGESRNAMVEAARIARGNVEDLVNLDPDQFDCLVIPGGFGVAKNLSTIAFDGENGAVIEIMEKIILSFHKSKKPIGGICISPALLAKVFQNNSIHTTLTLGESNPLLAKMGAEEVVCKAAEISYDSINKIVCTPAYMTNESLPNISKGIRKLVKKMNEIS